MHTQDGILHSEDSLMDRIKEAKKIAFKDPSLSFHMAKEVYEIAEKSGLASIKAHGLIAMSLACRSMTKLNDCFDYAYDALIIFEKLEDSIGIAGALNLMGVVYYYYAMYERAVEYFIRALYLLKETDDYISMSRLHNNLGEVYREVGNFDEALESYEKALVLCNEYNFELNAAVILENMGEIYFRKKQFSSSIECYEKSYIILAKNDDLTALAEVEGRIGKIHFVRNELEEARTYYTKALNKLEKLENCYFAIDILIHLAELEMSTNEKSFIEYMLKAIQYAEKTNARKKLSLIYKMMTDFYERKSNFERALEFYKRYHHMEQEIETTIISHKLEIIKIELSKLFKGEEVEKITKLNTQLEDDISKHKKMLELMEKTNRNLSVEVHMDELTNIPNRRAVNRYMNETWKEDCNSQIELGLFIIDIDHFKRYNDFYGHIEGDHCLTLIATCLKRVIGDSEGIFGRFGGEEFECFLKNKSYEACVALAESLRNEVQELGLTYQWKNKEYPVTVSVGGAYGKIMDFEVASNMLKMADEELYKAKKRGRNQVSLISAVGKSIEY